MVQQKGTCPRCQAFSKLTKHHVFPKRYWKDKKTELSRKLLKKYGRDALHSTQLLCAKCHKELEMLIHDIEKIHDHLPLELIDYINIVKVFLSNRASKR